MPSNIDKRKVINEAKREIAEENVSKYKVEYKDKLRALGKAKLVAANIEREIELLELKMEQELNV